jgi:large subunit ribosomal protein L3
MGKRHRPRHGSLQFYPRVRAKKIIPRVNWDMLSKENPGILGFIGYKVGMMSAYVKDNTPHSMIKGQRKTIPVTILECPSMKIYSVRFFKNKKLIGEALNSNPDKELKRKVKLAKQIHKKIEDYKDFDEVSILAYTQVKKTGIKKTPDMIELALSGTKEQKLHFVNEHLNKELTIKNFTNEGVVDVRGVTKGRGNQGSTKRFGLKLKFHKSEKGQRNAGSGGAWHPARVEFMQPLAGQMGFFTRIVYNNKIVKISSISEKDINPSGGFIHYGKINTEYIIMEGSVPGPAKRPIVITAPLRVGKIPKKKSYEFIELR